MLSQAAKTLTETVTTAQGESYELVWHVTDFSSRASAHAALRSEGYRFVRPVQRGGVTYTGTGHWVCGTLVAVVNGKSVHAR